MLLAYAPVRRVKATDLRSEIKDRDAVKNALSEDKGFLKTFPQTM